MEYIQLTKDNIAQEHICCAISNNKDAQVVSKKNWLTQRFEDGLVFIRSKERGKCFIEYMPAEKAWIPIDAKDYMYIDCFWVAGSLKGHGYSSDLLQLCIEDSLSKNKKSLCILSSAKKKPFLSDPGFLKHKGFMVADTADNGIQLWYLPLNPKAAIPRFKECAKHPHIQEKGFVLYYTDQCPFNAKYVPLLMETAKQQGVRFQTVHLETKEQAQNVPSPVTNFALFYDGAFITHEQMNPKKFEQIIKKIKGETK